MKHLWHYHFVWTRIQLKLGWVILVGRLDKLITRKDQQRGVVAQ